MDSPDLQEIAESVVELISLGGATSLEKALGILKRTLDADARRVATAYAMACAVVIKRKVESQGTHGVHQGIHPRADALAFEALDLALEGRFRPSFDLLRTSVAAGAGRMLCAKVVQTLLAGLGRDDRDSVLSYTQKGLVAIEVGRVARSGLVLLSGYQELSARQGGAQGRLSGGRQIFHLRSLAEVAEDIRSGTLDCPRFKNAPFRFKSVNWGRYFLSLSQGAEC